jgi:2-C-methyl-D-erythritol 4-phosphate cytidylyltransferase
MGYDDILRVLNTNLAGSIVVAKESFPYLREQKGSLTLFSSSSYTRGRKLYAAYSSSKAAIVNLTEALEDEWSAADIRVNCISPERTRTAMRLANFGTEDQETLLAPERVAEVTLLTIASRLNGRIVDVRV